MQCHGILGLETWLIINLILKPEAILMKTSQKRLEGIFNWKPNFRNFNFTVVIEMLEVLQHLFSQKTKK